MKMGLLEPWVLTLGLLVGHNTNNGVNHQGKSDKRGPSVPFCEICEKNIVV
jgi:hypothetical protein